ncbi:MAG: cell wall metabolism sensor histidine kinase WalK [Oscillospiraceae bacterium]|jgi:signal transduction histidine kinase|nr:cell wall metabolism sensor histidine kinase WalK [Oscillospiraceae bacterium]
MRKRFRIGQQGKLLIMVFSLGIAIGIIAFVMQQRSFVSFQQNQFVSQIQAVLSKPEVVSALTEAASRDAESVSAVVGGHANEFGIDGTMRIYYILSKNAQPAAAMLELPETVEVTLNITEAMLGRVGDSVRNYNPYMDYAYPVGDFIVYIYDHKTALLEQTRNNRKNMVGFALSALLFSMLAAMLISKFLVMFYDKVNKVANTMLEGEYPEPLELTGDKLIDPVLNALNEMVNSLRESEMQKQEFFASASHELRTPMTNVRSYAETLKEMGDDIDPETRDRFLAVILNESDRLATLVSDLQMVSKLDAGQAELDIQPLDIRESVRSVYNAISLDASKQGLHIAFNPGGNPLIVNADKARLEQVLMNIISNAVRYTPTGGSVTITAGTDRQRGEVKIAVRDTGIGIPKEDIPKLFDRFYRVDKARSRAKGGSGLGLAIAKEITERHGGRIEIQSEINKGTAVTIRLPQANANSLHA